VSTTSVLSSASGSVFLLSSRLLLAHLSRAPIASTHSQTPHTLSSISCQVPFKTPTQSVSIMSTLFIISHSLNHLTSTISLNPLSSLNHLTLSQSSQLTESPYTLSILSAHLITSHTFNHLTLTFEKFLPGPDQSIWRRAYSIDIPCHRTAIVARRGIRRPLCPYN